MKLLVPAVVLIVFLQADVRAQSISIKLSSKDAVPGEVLTAAVSVSNLGQANAPIPPQTLDFEIQQIGGVNRQFSTQIINGQQTSQQTFIYTFNITPLRSGVLTLGPFTVKSVNEELATKPIRIRVVENKSGETSNPLLFAEIQGEPAQPYVGQTLTLTLNVWVKQYNKDGIALDANDFWQLQDRDSVSLGIFANDKPTPREARHADAQGVEDDYFVYAWEATVFPIKPGPYDLGNITFGLQYPISFGRDIFRRVVVDRAKRIITRAKQADIVVLAIPDADRPPDFNGAVGDYSMSARAKPTEVQAGDPITLTLDISGSGDLQRLSPPRLIYVPDLVHNFDISGASAAGEMVGERKRFSLTIRPLREDVGEIPRIPMSYFDPESKKFSTSWTSPIPIKVRAAERLALSATPNPAQAENKSAAVETTEGMLANFTDPGALLADQSFHVGTGMWTLLAACPFVYAAVWFTEKRKTLRGANTSLNRRNRAYAVARDVLQSKSGDDAPAASHRAREALVGYIADRCNVPAGGLTRKDVIALLRSRGVPAGTIDSLDTFLEGLENIEYGGSAFAGDSVEQARQLLDSLEAQHIQ